jgi:hypothetical protein
LWKFFRVDRKSHVTPPVLLLSQPMEDASAKLLPLDSTATSAARTLSGSTLPIRKVVSGASAQV